MSKQRWVFGNYTFRINPNKSSQKSTMVGDSVRTLSGSYIFQPTTFQDSYDVSTIFYQPRTRLLSQVSINNSLYFEYYNGSYYSLNNSTNKIDVYNTNLVLTSSVSLPSLISTSYVGFDIYNGSYWILCHVSNNSTETLYQINMSTNTIINTYSISMGNTNQSLALENLNGTLWILRPNNILLKMNSNNSTIGTTYNISADTITALTSDGAYLIFAGNDSNSNPISFYFNNGYVIASIYSIDSINSCDDVSFDGRNIIYLNRSNNILSFVRPNTVDVDIYSFEQQIDGNHGYVQMADDTGLTHNIAVSNYSRNRIMGYENGYDVSFSIDKVDRGGNG